MNELSTYVFPETSGTVRTIMIGDDPWFMGADVCRELELSSVSVALSRLSDDEKVDHAVSSTDTLINIYISESGLYRLVFTSRKEAAERFRTWIASDVLPAIRKTGGYGKMTPGSFADALQLAADSQREIERQEALLAIAAPKAEAYDGHVDSSGGITIRALAKQLMNDKYRVTCKGMYEDLHGVGLIYRQGETWVPYEGARRDGLAESRWDICADGRVREVCLITPAGVLEVRRMLGHLRASREVAGK
jgi:anti-repressor protein